ncbi:hypothetical protein [Tenacibaculum sp. 190524A02b]|uniref:hypothetical protein n=1 Tax=Tenacibaculum vairaonense TaxID=3137860 RepID=UPI0031FB5D21
MQTYYKFLFVIGLLFEVFGQVLLSNGNGFVYAQQPIDFTHWFLLIGVAFMIPAIGLFPKNIYTYIGVPIIIIGIVCIIGMCVLDFIWWSQPTQEIRNEFASHIAKFPAIWNPFITTGPNFLNIGLLLLSFNYLRKNRIGVAFIIIATLIVYFGRFIPHRLIYAYLITAIGYTILFFKKPQHGY